MPAYVTLWPQHQSHVQVRKIPFHPFLLGAFPVLSLFSTNIAQFSLGTTAKPLGVTLLGVAVLWLLLSALFRDIRKAALLTSLVVLPFFTVGHVENAFGAGPAMIVTYIIWGAILLGAAFWLFRTRAPLRQLTVILNATAVVLVLLPATRIAVYEIRNRGGRTMGAGQATRKLPDNGVAPEHLPDIYYIMLDGYTRADVLEYMYGYDNSPFLDSLRNMGFYVADRSCSNYMQTLLCIASTLNFEYLQPLLQDRPVDRTTDNKLELSRLFRRNRVVAFLRKFGYRYVAFETGVWSLKNQDVDVPLRVGATFNMFQNELINLTPLAPAMTHLPVEDQYARHREQVLYTLDHLTDAASLRGPSFVFAHIMAPHPPFVLDASGRALEPARRFSYADGSVFRGKGGKREEYIAGYRGQVEYVNRRLTDIVRELIERSETPPIIIIQGDHGSRLGVDFGSAGKTNFNECFPILNVYFLPGGGESLLYEGISPVNSFRTVFNYYFHTRHDLIDDRSYYSPLAHPYDFHEVERQEIAPSASAFR